MILGIPHCERGGRGADPKMGVLLLAPVPVPPQGSVLCQGEGAGSGHVPPQLGARSVVFVVSSCFHARSRPPLLLTVFALRFLQWRDKNAEFAGLVSLAVIPLPKEVGEIFCVLNIWE